MSFKRDYCRQAVMALSISVSIWGNCLLPASAAPTLGFDSDHDVVAVPNAEVALKYNNKTFVPVKTITRDTKSGIVLHKPADKCFLVVEDFAANNVPGTGEQILIESYDRDAIGPIGGNRFSKTFLDANKIKEITFTPDRIAKETGYPRESFSLLSSTKCFEVTPKSGASKYNLFIFTYGNHVTLFARQLRGDVKGGFDDNPPNIVVDLRLGPTGSTKANVDLAAEPASTSTSQ